MIQEGKAWVKEAGTGMKPEAVRCSKTPCLPVLLL